MLAEIDAAGISAVIQGIDGRGRPQTFEGLLHLWALTKTGERADTVDRIVKAVAKATGVDIAVLSNVKFPQDALAIMEREPCWRWDRNAKQVERLNWEAP